MDAILVVIVIAVTFTVVALLLMTNHLDKLQSKADRQFYLVKELFDSWILAADRAFTDAESVGFIGRGWRSYRTGYEDAVYANEHIHCVNRMSEAFKSIPDSEDRFAAAEISEIESELLAFRTVYNDLVNAYNKVLKKPLFRQYAKLRGKKDWEMLFF